MAYFKFFPKFNYLLIKTRFKNLSEQYRMSKHSLRACLKLKVAIFRSENAGKERCVREP